MHHGNGAGRRHRSNTARRQSEQAFHLDEFSLRKLRSLLPLLGSDKSGEVLNAAAAIVRVLAKHRLDLHDLAARLPEPPPAAGCTPESACSAESPPKAPERPWVSVAIGLLKEHATCAHCLTAWEKEFVANIAAYRNSPSANQTDRLDAILSKVEALHG